MKNAKIKIGPKFFKFKNSFNDFNLEDIKIYMQLHDKLEEKELIWENKSKQLEVNKDVKQILQLSADMDAVDMEKNAIYMDLLLLLAQKKEKLKHYLETKKGITNGIIKACVRALLQHYGNFTDYWNSCPPVESFKIKVPGRLFYQTFKVHDMDKTLLLRETLANFQAQQALNEKIRLSAGSWDGIYKFLAIIVRPKNQIEEVSITKNAVVNTKELKGFDMTQQLEYYKERLEANWEKRAAYFDKLKINIAIGALKCYWKKKAKSPKNTPQSSKVRAR